MSQEVLILVVEALAVYVLVLGAHSLRHRFGQAMFYALLGGVTAIMSWLTDAGVQVQLGGVTFMVGSAVFYTALLLGVFVVYVFDGPHHTRIAILTVAGVSAMVPIIASVIHLQMEMVDHPAVVGVPIPNLRPNMASVITTIADLIFLAVAWEFLGKGRVRIWLWLRAILTLVGVMWLDVVLFATLAFGGRDPYLGIMAGTFLSRTLVCVFAGPVLYAYLAWQKNIHGIAFENRPVLAILREVAEMRAELNLAQREIARRIQAEKEKEEVIRKLEDTLARVNKLEGLLSICSSCKKIRVETSADGRREV